MNPSSIKTFFAVGCLIVLLSPLSAEAGPRRTHKIRVTTENEGLFFPGSGGYSCYLHPGDKKGIVGKMRVTRSGDRKVWRSVNSTRTSRKARRLKKRISRLEKKGANTQRLVRLRTRLDKQQNILSACDSSTIVPPTEESPSPGDGESDVPGGNDATPPAGPDGEQPEDSVNDTPNEIPTPQGPAPLDQLPSNNLRIDFARYVGVEGNDAARGSVFTARQELVVAGNFSGAVSGQEPQLLAGGSSDAARLLRMTPDGAALKEVIIGNRVDDLVYSYAQRQVLASGDFGVMALDATLDNVLWSLPLSDLADAGGGPDGGMTRVAVSDTGRIAVLRSRFVWIISPSGKQLVRVEAGASYTNDIELSKDGRSLYVVSFNNARRNGVPVQIPQFRTYSLTPGEGGELSSRLEWKLFGFQGSQMGNDMADGRLYRVTRGVDGKIYIAGESAGGNSIFRWDGTDFSTSALITRGPYYHAYNTKSNHILYLGQVDVASRKIKRGILVLTRLNSGGGNTIRVRNGDLKVDEYGTIYVSGQSFFAIQDRDKQLLNNEQVTAYKGGEPFLLMMSGDFSQTHRWTIFQRPGDEQGIDATGNSVAVMNGKLALFSTIRRGELYTLDNGLRTDAGQSKVGDTHLVISPVYQNP